MLFLQLLKLRALFGRQDGEKFAVHAFGVGAKLLSESIGACLLFGGERRAVASRFDEFAHLPSFGTEAFGIAFSNGAELLLLRVRQIELLREATKAVASAAFALVPTTTTHASFAMHGLFVLRAVLRRRLLRLLLREDAGDGENGDERERQCCFSKSVFHYLSISF